MLTFFVATAALAEPKSESPTRIKRDGAGQKTKSQGYHNPVGSPSRECGDEYYLLSAEEPKTDEEWSRRHFEARQLPKILSVLKAGNFAKAHRLLKDLAEAMPVDSQSRFCYQRLASLCQDRMDTEYWYRYDIRETKRQKDESLSNDQVSDEKKTRSGETTKAVQGLRKEAWLLLGANHQGK